MQSSCGVCHDAFVLVQVQLAKARRAGCQRPHAARANAGSGQHQLGQSGELREYISRVVVHPKAPAINVVVSLFRNAGARWTDSVPS